MCNKFFLLTSLIFLSWNLTIAQVSLNNNICGFDQLQQKLLANNPAYKAKIEAEERAYVEAMNSKGAARNSNVVYRLPTVIHIIHSGEPIGAQSNPLDITIKEVIKHTNDRFRHTSGLSFANPYSGVDSQIELCLANLSTNGSSTSGIIRYNRPDIATNATPAQFETFASQVRWDASIYYNIYIFSDINTDIFPITADAAYFPLIDATFFRANAFWSSGLLVHETGHYLSLAHTFQPTFSFNNDGCYNFSCLTSGDKVCDTPPKSQPGFSNSDCSISNNSCTTDESDFSNNNPYRSTLWGGIGDQPDMRENYMDYSGHCWAAFSQGQSARMRSHIANNRMSLVNHASIACSNAIPANVCASTPTNLSNSNISNTSMTLNWIPVTNATAYQITYKEQNAIDWTTINTTNTPTYTINNLIANTVYLWRVRALCSNEFYSDWAFFGGLSAPPTSCDSPTGLTVNNITTTTANISWNNIISASSYNLRYQPTTATTWSTENNITTTTGTISNLSANTAYQWEVQTNCGGNLSDWTAGSFSTNATNTTCAKPFSISATNISDNITLRWDAVANANTYQLQYKPAELTNWQTVDNLTNNSYALTATLQPSTTYNWQVRTQCTNSATSDWATGNFTTSSTAACSRPSFSGSTTENGNVNLSWGAVATATNYQIRYRIQGTNNWPNIYDVNAINFTPTEGLTANTTYDWEVRSVCNNLFSDWRSGAFTTSNSSQTSCTGTNITVQNTITNEDYFASTNINASCVINTGGTVTMKAGNTILLTAGFHATAGSSFTASIASCNAITNQTESISTKSRAQEITNISTILSNQETLTILPNPFQHKATIRFYLPKESLIQISILNLNGQVVSQQSIKGNKGWSNTQLDASQLPAGMYYTILQTATQQLAKKIMILR